MGIGITKKPSAKDIPFLDLSLQYDFPELCLFQNVYIFYDRVKRCRFGEAERCIQNACAAKL